jgi:flagellar biosynthesis chaperone FliJ
MELEIKLLKEREGERDSLTGLELTDGQPLNENMIQFKAKYSTTNTKYEQQISDLKHKIKKLDHKTSHHKKDIVETQEEYTNLNKKYNDLGERAEKESIEFRTILDKTS